MTTKKLTPLKAIRHYCRYECCANDITSWRECLIVTCPLFSFRFGLRNKTSRQTKRHPKQAVLHSKVEKQSTLQESSE